MTSSTSNISNEKILPMSPPILSSYPVYSNLLSVISNVPEASPWILSNYIQLVNNPQKPTIYFPTGYAHECPFITEQIINKTFIRNKWNNDIVGFIIDCINLGYYIYLIVDEYYISASWAYKKQSFTHDLFVFGYNKSLKKFNIADNFKHGIYAYNTCSFYELQKAYSSLKNADEDYLGFNGCVRLYNINPKVIYEFNIDLVIDSINDYLVGKSTPREPEHYRKNYVFGINVYNYMRDYLKAVHKECDLRAFHTLFEHKKLMLQRIQFMEKLGFLENSGLIYDDYSAVKNKCETNLFRLIKFNMTQNSSLLDKVVSSMDEIVSREKYALENLLNNIVLK
ncbi:hypothetical protein [Paenibacillus sp. NAIST15-1]|uniref:hypothetical protein n=1 Tax=Paenibacillus sp. NAIST15-1 TaxID=1605994 RepID=UPI00086B01BB|nr:hypothetical protein [Paenibacillus sp. NAIST15-1]GAV12345.1 hypothetical protein PBN151_2278 [Paenibacillus sp. NAIST15-1]